MDEKRMREAYEMSAFKCTFEEYKAIQCCNCDMEDCPHREAYRKESNPMLQKLIKEIHDAKTVEEMHDIEDVALTAYSIDKTITKDERKIYLKAYDEKILYFYNMGIYPSMQEE